MSIPILFAMKNRVLLIEETHPNIQVTKINEFISLRGSKYAFDGDIPVCSQLLKMINSAINVGKVMNNLMKRVEFHPI